MIAAEILHPLILIHQKKMKTHLESKEGEKYIFFNINLCAQRYQVPNFPVACQCTYYSRHLKALWDKKKQDTYGRHLKKYYSVQYSMERLSQLNGI